MSITKTRNANLHLPSTDFLLYKSKHFHPMVNKPLIIRLKKRPRPLVGMNITPMEDIKNRHRLINIVRDYSERSNKQFATIENSLNPTFRDMFTKCYNYLLINKERKAISTRDMNSFDTAAKKHMNIKDILKVNGDTANIIKAYKEENVREKRSKEVTRIFSKHRTVKEIPRTIRIANLFKDADIEEDSEYFQYKLISKANAREKKPQLTKLKEKHVLPKIIYKGKCNTYLQNTRSSKSMFVYSESTSAMDGYGSIEKSNEYNDSKGIDKGIIEDIKFAKKFRKHLLNLNKKHVMLSNAAKLLESDDYLKETGKVKPIVKQVHL